MGKVGVLSALVVGSLTPDLPYFLPLGVHRISSHSPAALFWFCLPAGLAGYLLFHSLLRPVLSFLFPPGLRSKLPVLAPGSWLPAAPLAGVLVSLLVGAVTHDVWDSFTHADGFLVRAFPPLSYLLFELDGYQVSIYKLLQHLSSLAGMTILAVWGWRWLARARPRPAEPGWRPPERAWAACWVALTVGTALVGFIAGFSRIGDTTGIWALQRFLAFGVTGAMAALGSMLLVLGLGWRILESRMPA